MSRTRYCLAVLLALSVAASTGLAGGFQLNEHGAKAMAMGGAFAAQASDGSAMFFNPAGLAFQKGFGVLLGGTLILPSGSYKAPSGTETEQEKQTFFAPNAYLSYGMDNGLAFGVSVYAPYGLGTLWPAIWSGRYAAVKTELQSIFINPSIAYKISDQFALGAGVSFVTSKVELSRRLPPTPPLTTSDGNVKLDADKTALNFNVGIMYKPSTEVSIGVSYRHETKMDYEGTATFTDMGALQSFFPGGTGKTTIKLPNNIFAGIAYTGERFTAEADFQYVGWSSYEVLTIDIPVGPTFPAVGRPLQGPVSARKDWKNSWILRGGAEYRLSLFALRAGIIYDKTPQPDQSVEPLLPDANRIEFTFGFGVELTKRVSLDAAYQLILWSDRTAPANPTDSAINLLQGGTYSTTANLFGLNLVFGL